MSKLSATFIYNGLPDYWGGNGRRWDDDAGCLFAYYDTNTSLRDIVDELVSDFNNGGDCDSLHEDITDDDIRKALMDMLTPQGRADYDSGAISEFSQEFADVNDLEAGVDYDDQVEDAEFGELPFVVVLIESENCSECGAWAEHATDDICEDCADKHGYDLTV